MGKHEMKVEMYFIFFCGNPVRNSGKCLNIYLNVLNDFALLVKKERTL